MSTERITFEIELEDNAHFDVLVEYLRNVVGAKNVKAEPVVATTMAPLLVPFFQGLGLMMTADAEREARAKELGVKIAEFCRDMKATAKKPPEDTA